MEIRQVFVVWKHPIFHDSVRLLLNHPHVRWIGSTSDYSRAKTEISRLQPDTILIEETEDSREMNPFEFLNMAAFGARVVSVSLTKNRLTVYQQEQRTVGHSADLLHLVLAEVS